MVDEMEVIQGKVIHSFSLCNLPSYHGTLSWSSDDRISIITEQTVHILTLLFSEDNTKSNIKYYLSSVPAKTDQHFHVEFKNGLDMYDLGKGSLVSGIVTKRLLSLSSRPPRNPGINMNAFKAVGWSPSGCDEYERCMLATLCEDHRLNLYMPRKSKKTWTETACISQQWYQHCQKVFLPIIEQKMSLLKKANRKVSEDKVPLMSTIEMNYVNHVSLTCFTWCPTLIDSNVSVLGHVQKFALLVAMTVSGKLTFWQVAVPVLCDKADVALVDGDMKCSVLRPCSIAWYSTDSNKGLVAIGGADGRIEVFNITITVNPECKVSITTTFINVIWNDADDLAVNYLSWLGNNKESQNDSSTTLVATKGSAIVHFELKLDEDKAVQETTHHVETTEHLSFICATSVTNNGKLFTCDVDSSIQMIDVGTRKASVIKYDMKPCQVRRGVAVSPNGLYMAVYHTPSIHKLEDRVSYKQIEVSIISLVSEELLSKAITCDNQGSMWDIQTGICQYYSQNDPPNNGPALDFLEHPSENLPLLSLYIRHRLTDQLANQSDESFTMDDTSSDITDGRDWKLEARETGQEIVRMLMTSSLKLKLDKYKESTLSDKERTSLLIMSDWLVMNYSDQVTLDLALQVYNMTDERDSITIATQLRQQGIMAAFDPLKCGMPENDCADAVDINNGETASKIRKTDHNTTQQVLTLPYREHCTLCQSKIPLLSLTSGQCTNGHAWKRCVITFCISADYISHRCQDCGSSMSLIGQEKSPWLQEVHKKSRVCSMCYGWQDCRQ